MKWIILLSLFPTLLIAQTPTDLGNASDQSQAVFDQLSGKRQEVAANDPAIERMPYFLSPACEGLTEAELKSCSERAMLIAIYTEVNYPPMARENGVEGMAVIRFVVEKDGSMSDLSIQRDPGGGLGEEALRTIQTLANGGATWAPGIVAGEAVRVEFMLPIKFALEDGGRARRRAERRAKREARRGD